MLGVMTLLGACSKPEATPGKAAAGGPLGEGGARGAHHLARLGRQSSQPRSTRVWFKDFSDKNAGIRVNYQATGSGAGIKAFTAGQTDFGASDAAMTRRRKSKKPKTTCCCSR